MHGKNVCPAKHLFQRKIGEAKRFQLVLLGTIKADQLYTEGMKELRYTRTDAMSVDGGVPFYAYSALFYNRFLRHFFGAYKFQQKTAYASVFQEILAAYVKQHPVLSQASWVSYIPQTHRREVLRGSHPAKALAESVASTLHLPLVSLLEKGMRHRAQKRISAWERRTNVKGAFSLSPSALHDPLVGVGIICDDFLTTGNTLFEAMQILNEVHWYAVGLTLACVDYPSQEESEGGWL